MNPKAIFRVLLCTLFTLYTGCLSYAQTYCVPATGYSCSNDYIRSFSTSGGTSNISNINSAGSATVAGCFSNQTAIIHTATPGTLVSFSIVNNPYNGEWYEIFADWNADGDFMDAGETVYSPGIKLAETGTATGMFLIPPGTTTGSKRLRVRCSSNEQPFDACSTVDLGETEDYTIQVVAAAPCTQPPSGGTIAAIVPDSVCPNTSFTLLVTGATNGSGIQHQWQSSPDGSSGSWTDLTGANAILHTVTGITTATYYRLKVSCGGGTPVYSNVKQIAVKDFTDCYCTLQYEYGCVHASVINSFSTSSAQANVSNLNTGCGLDSGYSNYTTMAISAYRTVPFYFTVTIEGVPGGVRVWADWNHDGTFDPVSELCAVSPNPVGNSFTGMIAAPATALSGTTRLRVRSVDQTVTFGPCIVYPNGETEDYTIHVLDQTPCINPPAAGSIAAAVPDSVCKHTAFALYTSGTASGSAMAYQWQTSATGAAGSWTDIAGAQAMYHYLAAGIDTEAYFRLQISCSGNTPVYTNIRKISLKPYTECYCIPLYSNGCYINSIDGFSTTGAVVDISNLHTGCTSGVSGYADYTYKVITAERLKPFNFTVVADAESPGVKLWADWNHDGSFDPLTELCAEFPVSMSFSGPFNGSITPPATALTGATRLRVRLINGLYPNDACDYQKQGEVEDYTLNVTGATGIGETAQEQPTVLVYPNPNNGKVLYIETADKLYLNEIAVYDVLARKVYALKSFDRHTGRYKITLPLSLGSGLYSIRIYTNKGISTHKLEIVK